MTQDKSTTPMMRQWHDLKKQAKDALLFFRLGDFYEAFFEDAEIIAKKLNLTLTKRQNIPMCGVPYHASESYIDKLVNLGFKLAIAEQVEDPKVVKKIVKRKIVRFVSPATTLSSALLSDNINNYFAAVCQIKDCFGIAYLDLTTADFNVIEVNSFDSFLNEIHRINPKELLIDDKFQKRYEKQLKELEEFLLFTTTIKDAWQFDHQLALKRLIAHFNVLSLDGFGMRAMIAAINAAGALITYLQDDLNFKLSNIQEIQINNSLSYMSIDRSTINHLELTSKEKTDQKLSLFALLDRTSTSMGARLLRKWIQYPLLDLKTIKGRQESVKVCFDRIIEIEATLAKIKDIERLVNKIKGNYESPRDFYHLILSLNHVDTLKEILNKFDVDYLKHQNNALSDFSEICSLVINILKENLPLRINDGNIFKEGYNKELDEYRLLSTNSKAWIANYQNRLKEETKIKTLKVGFTRVFGYYIDVSKGQKEKVPSNFQRRQTLVNSERYVTDELKDYEIKIFSADEKTKTLELKLYEDLKVHLLKYYEKIVTAAKAIAIVDVINSFATVAIENDYVMPTVDESNDLIIEHGRHPIVEQNIGGNNFIPNNTFFDKDKQLYLITGPNMAGKSTYIRQVAMIVILAQIGAFVPAKFARIGIIDKLFTRIGASDDLSRGQSTFMVEMTETANILNNATNRSLVILDEIGRGTSTYDGISIAYAVCEYLLTTEHKKAKTLFATHYLELTELEEKYPKVKNYQVAVKENNHEIIFLHQIVSGKADKSYGIHVAKLAGLPLKAIKTAEEKLLKLEKGSKKPLKEKQINFLAKTSTLNPLVEEIKGIDINQLSPIEAFKKLLRIQEKAHEL
jgi:DNA mismatch repair protein MutS